MSRTAEMPDTPAKVHTSQWKEPADKPTLSRETAISRETEPQNVGRSLGTGATAAELYGQRCGACE